MNKANLREETLVRITLLYLLFAVVAVALAAGQQAPVPASGTHTLTVMVKNVNEQGGNIGVLVFNSTKGWPEDRFAALRDVVVPAHPGTVTVTIPDLPTGDYALAVAHDVNKNHKVDKNMFGKPTEQWGMSNNPHATIKAPPFSAAKFSLTGDQIVEIQLK
jgi:uncharacterized protein (DUF2141 family)